MNTKSLQEHIKKVLREEDFIPLEDLNTVIKDYEGGFDVFIMNGDKKIGEISFVKENLPDLYTIVDATIDDEYKGNRIYPKTIINLFKERPNIIINSVFRSPEAEKAWRYILSNLPSNIGKSVKYYKEEDTTLYQLKLRNIQEHIKKVLREETDTSFFKGFDVSKFKNQDPPDNESEETKKEIKYLRSIKLNNKFFKDKDDILENFTDFLDEKEVKYDKELLKKLINNSKDIILILKDHYKRPRPFKLDKTFKDPALKSTTGYSYPSGHSTQSNLVSMVLGKMYPKYKKDFINIAEDIMYSRQMAKAHYPSDIKFGKKLATALFNYLVNNNLIKGNINENNDKLTGRRLLYIADEYLEDNLDPKYVCNYWTKDEATIYVNEAIGEITRYITDKIFDVRNYGLDNSDEWGRIFDLTYGLLLELNYDRKVRDFFYESLDNCEQHLLH